MALVLISHGISMMEKISKSKKRVFKSKEMKE